ncbi:glycosyltransferase [Geomonas paludis]|uniref:Glycosyltransferase n=1 Tax=Geomonas paludis TaxID=2740185 RepID=A0A6V8MVZ8_9BACT|nr:glycosyltransferase [Geomonas paludis]UPU34371.1 glycosyltransferase [Geomonas paludis]GFO64356.1 hypothetical protein GMPD_22750 [Geomonas paludis]
MTATTAPKVSVVMPVYNGGRFVAEAIDSILRQSFTDFEFLVVDDGSTDDSAAVLRSFSDPRMRLLGDGVNRGVVGALNLGFAAAAGRYVARMDADDVSLPDRLQRQVDFLDANPGIDVCGGWMEAFDGRGATLWQAPLEDSEIRSWFLFENVIYHPTVMLRRSVLLDGTVRYDRDFPHAEDYELWTRMLDTWRFANLGEVLLCYRLHDQSVGQRENTTQRETGARVRRRLLAGLHLDVTDAELALHEALASWRVEADTAFLDRAQAWLLKLLQANRERQLVPPAVLEPVLARRWYQVCFIAAPAGMAAYRCFFRSPLAGALQLPLRDRLIFALSALLRRGER